MDMLNSNPNETASVPVEDLKPVPVENLVSSVPAAVIAPAASTPEVTPAKTAIPAVAPVPVVDLAGSVSGTGTPKASPSTGGLGAGAPASVPAVKMELPKTTGTTVGGWNRFAGYNPNAAKNKAKDGRGGSGRR
jgi:hypothetical protein